MLACSVVCNEVLLTGQRCLQNNRLPHGAARHASWSSPAAALACSQPEENSIATHGGQVGCRLCDGDMCWPAGACGAGVMHASTAKPQQTKHWPCFTSWEGTLHHGRLVRKQRWDPGFWCTHLSISSSVVRPAHHQCPCPHTPAGARLGQQSAA